MRTSPKTPTTDPTATSANARRALQGAGAIAAIALLAACSSGNNMPKPSEAPTTTVSPSEIPKPEVDPRIDYLTERGRDIAKSILDDAKSPRVGNFITDKTDDGQPLLNNGAAASMSIGTSNPIPSIYVIQGPVSSASSPNSNIDTQSLYFSERVYEPTGGLSNVSIEFTVSGPTARELDGYASAGTLPSFLRLTQIVDSGKDLTFKEGSAQMDIIGLDEDFSVNVDGGLQSYDAKKQVQTDIPDAKIVESVAMFSGSMAAAQQQSSKYLA